MVIDQAHDQNNAAIKGDGGAVGLTQSPGFLRRWAVAGPKLAHMISEFDVAFDVSDMQTKRYYATMDSLTVYKPH